MDLLTLFLQAVLYGFLAGLLAYAVAWLIDKAIAIPEQTRRSIAVIIGVIVAILILIDGLS